MKTRPLFAIPSIMLTSSVGLAAGTPTTAKGLEEVLVVGQLQHLGGDPISASQGLVSADQLQLRPALRNGELLEAVPGLIVTQHSGDGKANQFFLRGFNLDHGTDLATSLDGVPVNMPSHAHGQGYTDIHFIIPELVRDLEYRKGPYYADYGDFSAVGAIDLRYVDKLAERLASLELGENNHIRAVLAGSSSLGPGTMLLGVEHTTDDGPWQLVEDLKRINAVLRYSLDTEGRRLTWTAQAYRTDWRSTDQIPLRAVRNGHLDRLGFIDPTGGGESHRYSLSAEWVQKAARNEWLMRAYAVDYGMDLFSNFTYATDAEHGDQFEQFDDRGVYGVHGSWRRTFQWGQLEHDWTGGVQVRRDDIDRIGLYRTQSRNRFATIREDGVLQTSYAIYANWTAVWHQRMRTEVGLRADDYEFDVASRLASNAGTRSDIQLSPKASVILGPWHETEFFVNAGKGFHSNDARGTTLRVDPVDQRTPARAVDPIVGATGIDLGLRTALVPRMQVSVSAWTLSLDSELVYVGDEGLTEASRASRRHGIEVGAIWNPADWLIVDADYAWSQARFKDSEGQGDRIPGAVESVASLGMAMNMPNGWFGGARLRHFGPAPLTEDNIVRSRGTTLVNVEIGYRLTHALNVAAAMFNVFDRKDDDITYFYASQLSGESVPIEDVHFHPVEPRTIRLNMTVNF